MTNHEAIEFLKNMIDREAIGFVCPEREGDVAIWQYHVEALQMAISALQAQDVPDTNVGDMVSRAAAIDAIVNTVSEIGLHDNSEVARYGATFRQHEIIDIIEGMPSAQPEWNNHTVACLLAELYDDTCACNYNGIDEWLPEKCEVIDSCPNPVGVACWEQYLKHRAERRTDE